MVKIAIIDSGLSSKSSLNDRVVLGAEIFTKNDGIYIGDNYDDYNGHGTKCANVILKYFPNAYLYIFKITYEQTLLTSIDLLIEALRLLINLDVDIINISMSMLENGNNSELNTILSILKNQHKFIVVSVKNGEFESYPANNINCIGVREDDLFSYEYRYIYRSKKNTQIITKFYPVLVADNYLHYNWFFGNSMATAYMSATIGKYIDNYGKEDIDLILNRSNYRMDWFDHICQTWSDEEIMILFKLKNTLDMFVVNYDSSDMIICDRRNNKLANIYEFLKCCSIQLDINIPYEIIEYHHFYSIHTIIKFFLLLQKP